VDVADLIDRVRAAAAGGGRHLVGITGPPGAGKSTLADAVVRGLGPIARRVPMDGFHLADAELERLGRRDRKGAPDTFDAAGYVALLRRLRDRDEDTVYAPEFHRDLEQAVAGSIAVPREVPVVVTEGNYLLLDDGPWAAVRPLLDEVWYVDADQDTRLELLVRRHIHFGKPPEVAREWVLRSDEANAALIAATRHRADLVHRNSYRPR
jgi:pantothenate kinase